MEEHDDIQPHQAHIDRRSDVNSPPSSGWTTRFLQVIAGSSTIATIGSAIRLHQRQQRLYGIERATPIHVEQLPSWMDGQQKMLDSTYGHDSSHLPPQYVSLSGRTSCDYAITTKFTAAPQKALWYSLLETKQFLRLFPFTRWQMAEEQRQTAYFETRDFELVGRRPAASTSHTPSHANSLVASSIAATSQSAAPPISVSIPSSMPADPQYFRSLVREVSDKVTDVSMSSSHFLAAMAEGRLQVKERNIERIVPVGQPVTVIGWVHRDPVSGTISLLPGTGPPTDAAQLVPKGFAIADMRTSGAPSAAKNLTALQPDLQAYSYSQYDHPCIISSQSHARILEEERAQVSGAKRCLIISAGITAAIVLVLVGRYVYKCWRKTQELQRLMEFHASRKERRELKKREKKERERRREAKLLRKQQTREIAHLKQAQVAYFHAAAAAASASSSSIASGEGMPHYGPVSPSPRTPIRSAGLILPVPTYGASSSSSASSSYVSRTGSPSYGLPPRHSSPIANSSRRDELCESDSSDGRATDDEASNTSDGSDDHSDYCVVCAEQKPDACMLPCAHLYTCCFCASKLAHCPICRTRIEKIVKVFSQQV